MVAEYYTKRCRQKHIEQQRRGHPARRARRRHRRLTGAATTGQRSEEKEAQGTKQWSRSILALFSNIPSSLRV
eukprot:6171943-Pleurochrysis_carterae.AAC.1